MQSVVEEIMMIPTQCEVGLEKLLWSPLKAKCAGEVDIQIDFADHTKTL